MIEEGKLDERIAPRYLRAEGRTAASSGGRDGKPLTHGVGDDGANALYEGTVAPCHSEGAVDGPRTKRARLSSAQKAGVGVAATLSVLLVAVSAYFAVVPPTEVPLAEGLLATTQEAGPSNPTDEPDEPDELDVPDEPVTTDPQQPGEPEEVDVVVAGDAPEVPSSDPAVEAVVPPEGAPSNGTSSSSPDAPSRPATVTVSVSVDSSAADGRVSGGANPTFEQGATVYDALMACGLSVNASSTPFGIYVSAIGGLAEKEYPGESGWKYSVNGEVVMKSCDNVVLQDGDVVCWYYSR